jgi:hypothetical protein
MRQGPFANFFMGGWGLDLKQQRQRNTRPHGPVAFVVAAMIVVIHNFFI